MNSICCCCCCCLHISFLTTQPGIFKICEAILTCVCQTLMLTYGSSITFLLGSTYNSFIMTAASTLFTILLLLASYILSESSYLSIRKSNFEIIFNIVACFMFLSEAGWLLFKTIVILWPIYLLSPIFTAFPAMMATAILGLILASIHAADAKYAYKSNC